MKADELEQRLKNALIYGTSHPEVYMKKADELWEKYASNGYSVSKSDFLAALTEYGEHVKAEAVKVCIAKITQGPTDQADTFRNVGIADCAAAIEGMKLP